LAGLALVVAGAGAWALRVRDQSTAVRTVPQVDLTRYLGNWYVIANIPYFLEKGKVATYDTYSMRPDGRMNNTFQVPPGFL